MRILLVEGRPHLTQTICRSLESLPDLAFTVDVAAGIDEARAKVRSVEYDAVILDVMAPEPVVAELEREARAPVVTSPPCDWSGCREFGRELASAVLDFVADRKAARAVSRIEATVSEMMKR